MFIIIFQWHNTIFVYFIYSLDTKKLLRIWCYGLLQRQTLYILAQGRKFYLCKNFQPICTSNNLTSFWVWEQYIIVCENNIYYSTVAIQATIFLASMKVERFTFLKNMAKFNLSISALFQQSNVLYSLLQIRLDRIFCIITLFSAYFYANTIYSINLVDAENKIEYVVSN